MVNSAKKNVPRLLLRSEPFGGIVADRFSSRVRFYNSTGFFLVNKILSGYSNEDILNDANERFYEFSQQDFLEHINICREGLQDFINSNDPEPLVGDTEETVPVLKSPLDLQLEITKHCNLSCKHCYNSSSQNCNIELPLEYIENLLEEFVVDRIRFLSITGGEPLLHPQLEFVLKKGREVAESVTLSTNGTLVSEKNGSFIIDYIDTVNISLDAPRSEIHDRFRQQRGCFEKAKRSIKYFANKGTDVVVQTTVFRENLYLLNELGRLIKDEGAKSWSVRLPLASGRAMKNTRDFLSAEEIRDAEAYLDALHEMKLDMEIFAGIPVPWSRKERYHKVINNNKLIACTAGTVLAAVLADKRLTPCILFSGTDYAENMINPKDIKRLWRESGFFNKIRKIRLHDIPLCRNCGHYGVQCKTACRAKAYIVNADIATPDPDCDFYRSYQKYNNLANHSIAD